MVKFEKGDFFGDLVGNGIKCGVGFGGIDMGKCCVDFVCVFDFVYVLVVEGFFGGDRKIRLNDVFGINGWDE